MDAARLSELIERFGQCRVAVFGDHFLDRYLDFDPDLAELSVETGRIANQVVRVRHSPGAAGTVVGNLAALGAGAIVPVGFVGDDGEGWQLLRDLEALGCGTDRMLVTSDRMTPTYLKPQNIRVAGLEGESERYDTKNRDPLPHEIEVRLAAHLAELAHEVDAVIVADQIEEEGCGVLTAEMRATCHNVALAAHRTVFWVDSRCRIGCYNGVIVKPNQREAVAAMCPGADEGDIDVALEAALRMSSRTAKPVFVTLEERGSAVADRDEVHLVRGVKVVGPTDPTGAGDSYTAAAVLALASGAAPEEAALIGNLAASITVQCIGTTGTASREGLAARLNEWTAQHAPSA